MSVSSTGAGRQVTAEGSSKKGGGKRRGRDGDQEDGPETSGPVAKKSKKNVAVTTPALEDSNEAKDAPSQNKITPAATMQGLRSTSLDALRIVLNDFRSFTSLAAGEQNDLIPPTDARQVFVTAFVKGAGDESQHTARPIFEAWSFAEQRGGLSLIPVILNVLTNVLRLLSMHSPTHPLGDSIIRQLMPSNRSSHTDAIRSEASESYFERIQGYIAGTQRPNTSGHTSSTPATKGVGHDALVIASLRMLAEVVSFAGGAWAKPVFDNFNWGAKSLAKLLTTRRKHYGAHKKKGSSASQTQQASIARPDARTAFIIFFLSFLKPLSAVQVTPDPRSHSKAISSTKAALISLSGRDFHTPLLKGLAEDAPTVVAYVLDALHAGLLSDPSIPRTSKLSFFNEWNCAHLLSLYQRQWETLPNINFASNRLSIAETAPKRPTVAELAHHFMLSLCTHPGFGICFKDDSWYPRSHYQAAALASETEEVAARRTDRFSKMDGSLSLENGLYNRVLLGVLRHLTPTRSLPHQELAFRILEACPELVGAYLNKITSTSAGVVISLEPRASSSAYITSLAWLNKIFALPIPSFASKAGQETSAESNLPYRPQPPPLNTVLASLLPQPLLTKAVLMRACFHSDRLVRHQASVLLATVLLRISRFNEECMLASTALGEDVDSIHRSERAATRTSSAKESPDDTLIRCAWALRCREVQSEARTILPELDSFVGAIQLLSQPRQPFSQAAATTNKKEAAASNPKSDSLLLEANLRVLWLYFLAVPLATFDSTFDVGKLLFSRFMSDVVSGGQVGLSGSEDGNGEEQVKADLDAEQHIRRTCQLHALRIVAATASGSPSAATQFVRNAVGGALAHSTGTFDLFARPATSSSPNGVGAKDDPSTPAADGMVPFTAKTYFSALLSIGLSSASTAVQSVCQELLQEAAADSVLFQHDRREWPVWMLALPRSDLIGSDHGPEAQTTRPEHGRLTREQVAVLNLVDDSLLRTMRTPYRYIEASRRCRLEGTDAQDTDSAVTDDDLMAASPLLHTMVEQFCIRSRKRLLDAGSDSGTERIALLAFFNRLLVLLTARGLPVTVIRKLQNEITAAATSAESQPSAAVSWLSKVFEANVDALQHGPHGAKLQNGSAKGARKKQANDASPLLSRLTAAQNVAPVRDILRSSPRPLGREEAAAVGTTIKRLHCAGLESAAQLLFELDPSSEATLGDHKLLQDWLSETEHADMTYLPLILHGQASTIAQLIRPETVEWPGVYLFGAVIATNRLQYRGSQGSSIASFEDDAALLEACLQGGIDHDDLRDVVINDHLISQVSEDPIAPANSAIISALAMVAESGDARTQAVVSALGTRVVQQLIKSNTLLDVNALKSAVQLLPLVDDQSLTEFVDKILKALLIAKKGSNPVNNYVLAAVHRALVFANNHSVAEAVIQNTIGSEARGSANDTMSAAMLDLVGCAILRLTLPGVLTTVKPGRNLHQDFGRYESITLPNLDHELIQSLSTLEEKGSSSSALASVYCHSAQAAAAMISWATTQGPETLKNAALPALCASVDVVRHQNSRFIVDQWANASRLHSFFAESTFADDTDTSSLAAATMSMLIDVDPQFIDPLIEALSKTTPSEHRKAFNYGAISLCTTSIHTWTSSNAKAKKSGKSISAAVRQFSQKLIASGLLWIVRRFAEDAEDSAAFLQILAAFNELIESILGLDIEIPGAVAEPVIEAALTQRWNEPEPLRLVEALCKVTKSNASGISKVAGRLTALMSSSHLQISADFTTSPIEDARTRITCAIADRSLEALSALVRVLVVRYRGRLNSEDVRIMQLLQRYEAEYGISVLDLFWSAANSGEVVTAMTNPGFDLLSSLNPATILKTATTFARWRRFDHHRLPKEEQIDPSVFDPLFILLTMNVAVSDPAFKGLDILALLRSNAIAVALSGLSSRCSQVRQFSSRILAKVRALTESTSFNERGNLLLILDAARNVLHGEADIAAEALPLTITTFLGHALQALANPAHFTYPLFTRFLLQRPLVDPDDIPMLYNMLSSSSEHAVREREWMLRFLRDCMRAGGRAEWRIFKRRHVWELVCSLYTSQSRTDSKNGTVRELMLAIARLPHASRELLGRKHVLSWVNEAIALEQRAKAVASPFWLRFASELLAGKQVDEVDRLTQGYWTSSIISILNSCVPDASASFGQQALQDACTLCARIATHWQSKDVVVLVSVRLALMRIVHVLIGHASKLTAEGTSVVPITKIHLAIIRMLFQIVLSLKSSDSDSTPATGQKELARLFPAVLRLALAVQLPEARSLALQHLSNTSP
ncbi:hypothetical protein OC845_000699 [Tilletia horrida]|nr:hypothetical protein OC845_000699 [Tilletia horrida]